MANFLDTFGGAAGNLAGHTADSGQGWIPNSGSAITYQLDGAGEAYSNSDTNLNDDRATADYTPGPDQRIRLAYRRKATITQRTETSLLLRVTNESGTAAAGNLYYLGVSTKADGTNRLAFWSHVGGGSWTPIGTGLDLAAWSDGDLIDFTVLGSRLRAYYNGALELDSTDGAAVAASGKVGIYGINPSATTDSQFGRIQACTLGEALGYTLALSGGNRVGQVVTATVTPEVFDGAGQTIAGHVTVAITGVACVPSSHTFTFAGTSAAQNFDFTPISAGTMVATGTNDLYLWDAAPQSMAIVGSQLNAIYGLDPFVGGIRG